VANDLYQYCVCYHSDEKVDNTSIVEDCSLLFMIDGQNLTADDFIAAAGVDPRTVPENDTRRKYLNRATRRAADSIHFQQVRAHSLALQLLEQKQAIIRKIHHRRYEEYKEADPAYSYPEYSDRNLRIAIIGGGISGLTCALSLKAGQCPKVDVTVFEYHNRGLPRFFQAYGRRVYPYHHLRWPSDKIEESGWPCPVTDSNEIGGIRGVLEWNPGAIEDINRNFAAAWEEAEKTKGIDFRLQSLVKNIHCDGIDFSLEKQAIPQMNLESSSIEKTLDIAQTSEKNLSQSENFDVVIFAIGGSRDVPTIAGQFNVNYWTPYHPEILTPQIEKHRIVILGNGDSAASEIYNQLFPGRCFQIVLNEIKKFASMKADLTQFLAGFEESQSTKALDFSVLFDSLDSELDDQ
jgi:hypothetical protein